MNNTVQVRLAKLRIQMMREQIARDRGRPGFEENVPRLEQFIRDTEEWIRREESKTGH